MQIFWVSLIYVTDCFKKAMYRETASESLCDDEEWGGNAGRDEIMLEGWVDRKKDKMRFKLSPVQDALFSCPYLVIENAWATGLTGIVGNELSPLHCNHYFEGQWTGSRQASASKLW